MLMKQDFVKTTMKPGWIWNLVRILEEIGEPQLSHFL